MDLVAHTPYSNLPVAKPEYNLMLKNIDSRMPPDVQDTSNFHK